MSDIMSISRLRIGTDGTGIRTLIGFYGCPLNCKYCANNYCHQSKTVRADYTAEELIETLSIDEPYYLMTNGGVTFGGGEPLLQAAFIHEVCSKMNSKWSKVIETSLYGPWEQIELLIQDIDYWYIDIKDLNPDTYKNYTGKSNRSVLSNLRKLIKVVSPEKICIRVPFIPEYNTQKRRMEEVEYIRQIISPDISFDVFDYIRCEN